MAASKLVQLRNNMRKLNLFAYLVPSEDAHMSEYIAACDMRRKWISNFSGSAGFAIISQKDAALWTDGRYYLQADMQLDKSCWNLMKQGLPSVLSKEDWLLKNLPPNSRVGIDPSLITVAAANSLLDILSKKSHTLVPVKANLIDEIWLDRPDRPCNPVKVLDTQYSGQHISEKINLIQKKINEKERLGLIVCALDEVAWLLNLRGSDISFNPVFFSYAVVHASALPNGNLVTLYIDPKKVSEEIRNYLSENK
ncbi:hypothetical protein HK096_011110, partial [Nowakowskiella sp. JEL0078]